MMAFLKKASLRIVENRSNILSTSKYCWLVNLYIIFSELPDIRWHKMKNLFTCFCRNRWSIKTMYRARFAQLKNSRTRRSVGVGHFLIFIMIAIDKVSRLLLTIHSVSIFYPFFLFLKL
jgi:hypothetical protein